MCAHIGLAGTVLPTAACAHELKGRGRRARAAGDFAIRPVGERIGRNFKYGINDYITFLMY